MAYKALHEIGFSEDAARQLEHESYLARVSMYHGILETSVSLPTCLGLAYALWQVADYAETSPLPKFVPVSFRVIAGVTVIVGLALTGKGVGDYIDGRSSHNEIVATISSGTKESKE